MICRGKFVCFYVVGALLSVPTLSFADRSDPEQVHRWKFLVAHNPVNEENNELIKAFAGQVAEATGGGLLIEPARLEQQFSNPHPIAIGNVFRGEMEMSQVSVDRLFRYCPEMDALDAPLVFRDHEHSEKVLDGAIGNKLKKCLLNGSNGRLRGLYFTYSGGYRNIYSTKPLTKLADLQGMKMAERAGRQGTDMMDLLGVKFVAYPPFLDDFMRAHSDGRVDAEESEISRLVSFRATHLKQMDDVKYVLETNHSLYLTLVVVNGAAYDSLSKKQQAALESAAKVLAREERKLSIEQEIRFKKELAERGVVFSRLSKDDRRKLKSLSQKIHSKYRRQFGEMIKAVQIVR